MPAVNPVTIRVSAVKLRLLYPDTKLENPLFAEMSRRYDAAPVVTGQLSVKDEVVIAVVVPKTGAGGTVITDIVDEFDEEPVPLTARTR